MTYPCSIPSLAIMIVVTGLMPPTEGYAVQGSQSVQQTDSETLLADSDDTEGDFTVDPDQSASDLVKRGADAMSANKIDSAVLLFEAAVVKDPTNAMIHNNLAYSLLKCSKPDPKRALRLVDKGLSLMPENATQFRSYFLDTRGLSLMQLSRFKEAIATYELALADRPEDLVILEALVKCHEKAELDSTAYAEQLERLKKAADEKANDDPKPDPRQEAFLQAMKSKDPNVIFDALVKANDWQRDAALPTRISQNQHRVQLADRLLSLGEPVRNHRELAINSKIKALEAIYGLNYFYNTGDKKIAKQLSEYCNRFITDPNDFIQRNARLGLLKHHVFENFKHKQAEDANAAKAEMLEVLKRFPDSDACLKSVELILKSAARFDKDFRLKLIEHLQLNLDQFKSTAAEDFILNLETTE